MALDRTLKIQKPDGTYIDFNNDSGYVLNSIDLGSTPFDLTTYEDRIGLEYYSSKLNKRTIKIVGFVVASDSDEMNDRKRALQVALSPFRQTKLLLGNLECNCYPTSSLQLSSVYAESSRDICKFSVSLDCLHPYFEAPITIEHNGTLTFEDLYRFDYGDIHTYGTFEDKTKASFNFNSDSPINYFPFSWDITFTQDYPNDNNYYFSIHRRDQSGTGDYVFVQVFYPENGFHIGGTLHYDSKLYHLTYTENGETINLVDKIYNNNVLDRLFLDIPQGKHYFRILPHGVSPTASNAFLATSVLDIKVPYLEA